MDRRACLPLRLRPPPSLPSTSSARPLTPSSLQGAHDRRRQLSQLEGASSSSTTFRTVHPGWFRPVRLSGVRVDRKMQSRPSSGKDINQPDRSGRAGALLLPQLFYPAALLPWRVTADVGFSVLVCQDYQEAPARLPRPSALVRPTLELVLQPLPHPPPSPQLQTQTSSTSPSCLTPVRRRMLESCNLSRGCATSGSRRLTARTMPFAKGTGSKPRAGRRGPRGGLRRARSISRRWV